MDGLINHKNSYLNLRASRDLRYKNLLLIQVSFNSFVISILFIIVQSSCFASSIFDDFLFDHFTSKTMHCAMTFWYKHTSGVFMFNGNRYLLGKTWVGNRLDIFQLQRLQHFKHTDFVHGWRVC